MGESSALDSPQPVITESTEELTEAQFLPSQKDTYILTVGRGYHHGGAKACFICV